MLWILLDSDIWTGEDHTTELLEWCGGLAAAVLVGTVIFYFVLRHMKRSAETPFQADFSLDDLRQLHAAGQLTQQEYDAAKAKVIERTLKAQAPAPRPAGGSGFADVGGGDKSAG